MIRRTLLITACAASFGILPGARADEMPIQLHAPMDAAQEVPPNQSKGTGSMEGTLNRSTKELTYTVTYQNLTGPATAAHFHGPANPGQNAPVVIPLQQPLTSPIKGKATLTDQQMNDLLANKWYVNVHTQANPGGEIRGQVAHGGP
ncbi:MAG TPA: CHRD domain-containing protein [Acetobacteraceae bacterium]|nr:CHRD domain-containing protein [Acetobacteraceae bacterium]